MRSTHILFLIFIFPAICRAEPTPQKIGVLLPLTGNFASYGALVRKEIEKVQPPGIEWVFEDDLCEPANAISAFQKLSVADGAKFILGPCCGSPQKAVAPLLAGKKQIALLPNAASTQVFELSAKRMYSVQYSLEADGAFVAEQMNQRGLKKAAVIFVDTDFSQALQAAFLKSFKGKVAYTMQAPAFDAQYMKAAALKLKKTDFDSIFIPDASPLILGLLTELKKLEIPRRPAFSVYAAQMKDVLDSEKENAEGLLYSYPDVPAGEDAFGYFPRIAAKILAEKVLRCAGDVDCVAKNFAGDKTFQSDGTLGGKLVLKTVHKGHFVLAQQ